MSAGGESGARGPLPDPDFSLHGLTISPEKPAKPVQPLPEPAGGFTFVRELGRGGMGVVYEAVEDATGRRVALKIIAERLGGSSRAVERFEREARLAASIAHPNCVFVYGAHVVHGATAISMELMTGQTLDDRIKSGEPVPVEKAVQWAIEILEGLAAAHAVGIVHRDVKPSNCFLTADGHVKVGDFGLSRSIDSDLGLTQSGSFVGSPLYASPEQIRGRAVDQRADVYSAGATIYAVLAGRPPHGGSSIGDVLAQIVSEAPTPLASVRHGLPRGLDAVVGRAIAKDPAKRFQDCAAFQRALLPFMPGSLSPATLGLRIVAYIIDVIIISSLYQGVCALLFISGFRFTNADPNAAWIPTRGVWAWIAPTLANVLWFSVGEGVFGTTVGKLMFGLRVVAIDGSRTPLWRAVVRAVVFFAPSTLPTFFWGLGTKPLQALYRLPSYLFPMITMRPSNAWRGFHEFASGTRVLRAQPRAMAAGLVTVLDPPRPPAAEIPAAIGGYAVEGLVGPTSQGAVVVARDPELDRRVWIHLGGHRRPDSSPTRAMELRWLHHGEQPLFHDVYEYPGGAGLHEYATASPAAIPWTAARVLLADLAEDLAERSGDLALSQIWIDRSGRLRVLDFAIGDPAANPPRPVAETFTAAARILLSTPASDAPRVPTDVPVHAEATVKRLVGGAPPFASVEEARVELRAIASRPAVVTRMRRLGQAGLAGLWLVYIGLIMIIASHTVLTPEFRDKLGPLKVERATGGIAAFMILAAIVIPSLILAFALRGGLTFTLLGVRLRNRKGRIASRFRCVLRSAVTCLPLVPVLVAALAQLFGGPPWILAGGIASAVVYLAGAAWSLRTPAEGIADRAARTRLVVK